MKNAADFVVVGPAGTLVPPAHSVGTWPANGSAADAGKLAGAAIARAVALALAGDVDGVVTAPIDKAALAVRRLRLSRPHRDARIAHGTETVMMLALDRLRVVLATTHVPLRDVTRLLTADVIMKTAAITRSGLADWFGLASPRIALCALNPHAGDGGRLAPKTMTCWHRPHVPPDCRGRFRRIRYLCVPFAVSSTP